MAINSGEQTSRATKDVRKWNMEAFKDSDYKQTPMGRRIDLIISTLSVELSSSEWKKENVPTASLISQQIKNARTNKAMLKAIEKLPLKEDNITDLLTLGMDWIGSVGYTLSIQRFDDVFVVQHVGDLKVLAINGIVLLDDDLNLNIVRFDHHENACEEIKESYLKYKDEYKTNNAGDIVYFTQLITEGNHTKAEEMLSASSLPGHVKAILYSIKQTYCKGYSIELVYENTLMKDAILPFLINYFPNNKRYTIIGADKEIPESKKRFTDVDPSLLENAKKRGFFNRYKLFKTFSLCPGVKVKA